MVGNESCSSRLALTRVLAPLVRAQGVQQQVPGAAGRTRPATKVTVVLHPDTMFQGAHANLLRVLHLEGVGLEGEEQQQLSHHHHHHHHHHEDAAGSDGHAEGEAQLPGRSIVGSDSEGGGRGRARSRSRSRSSAGGVGEHSHRGSGDELGDVGSEAEGHGGARRESGPDVEAQNQAKLHRIASELGLGGRLVLGWHGHRPWISCLTGDFAFAHYSN